MSLSVRHGVLGLALLGLSCQATSRVAINPNTRLQRLNMPAQRIAEPSVIEMPSPNSSPRRPANTKVSAIVLHHTAMKQTAREVGRFFQRKDARVSAHYTIDRTGYIVRSVPDNMKSWHAGHSTFQGVGNVNNYSIGIEICNLGDSQEPYPDAQYDGLIKLMAYLVDRYDIPMNRITRHRDISIPPGRKIDTSNNFSVRRVIDGIQALRQGNYRSPAQSAQPDTSALPDVRNVTLKENLTLEDVADIYLDNPARVVEVQAVNPQISASDMLTAGTQVVIPNNLDLSKY